MILRCVEALGTNVLLHANHNIPLAGLAPGIISFRVRRRNFLSSSGIKFGSADVLTVDPLGSDFVGEPLLPSL